MSGFLNPKERILDIQLTNEGKKQLSLGALKINYASFSDAGIFYSNLDQYDSGSYETLNTKRLNLEAKGRPQDTIIFSVDDSGKLKIPSVLGLSGSNETFTVINGQINFTSGGFLQKVSASLVSEFGKQILSTSFNNYKQLSILQTKNFNNQNVDFKLSTNSIEFNITRNSPIIVSKEIFETNINDAESLFIDKRLSNLPNFKFLPPINKKLSATTSSLGIYPNFGYQEELTEQKLTEEFEKIQARGSYQKINFSNASESNRIIGQIFEINNKNISKLDIVDFGNQQYTENGIQKNRQIYFVGKLFLDDNNTHTFINIFTLVFS